MINNSAIANLILSNKIFQIPSIIQTHRDAGMQLLDQALLDAIQKKEVDPDDAFRFANEKRKFARFVTDTSLVPTLATEAEEAE